MSPQGSAGPVPNAGPGSEQQSGGDLPRVVIAEDEALLREGLAAIVGAGGFEVVAVAEDADALLRKAKAYRPEVVITDVRMPPDNRDDGLRAAVELRSENPDLRVLVLSQHIEESYLMRLMSEDAGGIGYMLKQRVTDGDAFLDALRRVANGGSAVDPEVISVMMGRTVKNDPLEELTDRQRNVLALMAEGYSNLAIAEKLHVAERTVEKHIWSIMSALDLAPSSHAHRRVAAVLKFLESSGP